MKKITLILLSVLLSIGAWAATVNDLVAIDHDWVFIADDITSNGTVGLTANTLYADGKIFTPTAHSVANNKGNCSFAGGSHLNSLRLKLVQDRLAFKVSGPCTAIFYTQSQGERGIVISKTDRTNTEDEYWMQQPASTTSWEVDLDEAGVYYLSNYGGDFYFAGIEFHFADDPNAKIFGIGRTVETAATSETANILSAGQEQLKGEAPAGVVVTLTTTCDYTNNNATMYHGATTNAEKYTAVNAWRNYLNTVKVAVNGAYNEGFYAGFSVTIPKGKRMNVLEIYGDFLAEKNNFSYKFEVFKNNEKLFESDSHAIANIQNCGADNVAMTVDTRAKEELRNLTGTVEFRMPWWIASSAASGAVLDFSIKAVIEDIPQMKDIRMDFTTESSFIRTVTSTQWENFTTGIAVDGEGVVSAVDVADANSVATLAARYHSTQYGINLPNLTVKVDGPVRISHGSSYYDATMTIKKGDETLASLNTNKGTLWSQARPDCVSYLYTGGAATLTISANSYCPYLAVEKVSNYNITYSLGESGAEGTLPANLENQDPEDQYTVPTNKTLYKEGYTLKGWTDGENNYLIGESYTMTVGDYTLTPVFVANTVALGDATTETTIHWEFQTKEGAPVIAAQGNSAILVSQTTINGDIIDVCLHINAMSGKFNNSSNDDWAQVNPNTVFTFPSEKFAIVRAFSMNDPSASSTLDGEAYSTYTSNVATWTANPTSGVSTFNIQAGSWYRYLELTIPAVVVVTDHMTDVEWAAYPNSKERRIKVERTLVPDMYNTLCVPYDWTPEGGNFDAYFGAGCEVLKLASSSLENNELVLTFASTNKMTRGTAYLVKPTVEVSSWTVATTTKGNLNPTQTTAVDFIATYLPIELTASENTLCVGASDRLFYVSATSTMKGLRAYFQVKGAAAGAPARISLGGHVATGLESAEGKVQAAKCIEQGRVIIRIDGHDYDLNGRLLK